MAGVQDGSRESSPPSTSPSSSSDCILVDNASKTSNSTRPTSVSSVASHEATRAPKRRPKGRVPQTSRLESFGFTSSTTRPCRAQNSSNAPTAGIKSLGISSSNRPETWLDEASEDETMRQVSSSSKAHLLVPMQDDARKVKLHALFQADGDHQDSRRRPSRPVLKAPLPLTDPPANRQLSGETLVGVDEEPIGFEAQDSDNWNEEVKDTREIRVSGIDLEGVEPVKGVQTTESNLKSNNVRRLLDTVASKASSLGKRSRDAFERGKEKLHSIERRKSGRVINIVHEEENQSTTNERPSKKTKRTTASADARGSRLLNTKTMSSPKKLIKSKKVWMKHGLYVGQDRYFDVRLSGAQNKAKRASLIGSAVPQENKSMPLPMYFGDDLLKIGRDFKLPFDIYNPLPPGQPKPDEWKKTQSNRVVGDAIHSVKDWSKFSKLPSSSCLCTPELGCNEDCLNRMMLYECDNTNCALGPELCTNRAFAELKERCKTGRKYDIGVEVVKTDGKGFGIRANRTFEPNQVIVEYAGEIIDQEECNRRMQEEYKDARCYYLMLFDNNMIIDATRGTIARFVNHSCEPNCEMVKWNVAGKPRMALFAGDNGIMTGEELTYDYNYDNFNESNTTPCACGAATCRGVLGRKPTEQEAKKAKKTMMAAAAAAAKARLENMLAGLDKDGKKKKKHKGWVYLDANGNEIEEPEAAPASNGGKVRKRKLDAAEDDAESTPRGLTRAMSGLRRKKVKK